MSARDAALVTLTAQIGQNITSDRWVTIDQPMIDAFADTTLDDQWIHVDPERAAQTPFGGTIAHGFLTLSFASRFAYDCFPELPGQTMGINYGFDRLRFLSPVVCDAKIRGRFTLKEVVPRGAHALQRRSELTIDIAGSDKPALVADWLGLVEFTPNSPP